MKKLGIMLVGVSLIIGCASNPNKISASYVSPLKYNDYDCDMLALESASIERRTNDLYYSLKKESDKDSGQMAVGLILFWPALFFLEGGDGPEAAEYAQLKGEYDALQDVSVVKKCDIEFVDNIEEAVQQESEIDLSTD